MEQVKSRLLLLVLVFSGLFANAQENPTLDAYEGLPMKMHREKLYFGETYNAPGSHLLTDEEFRHCWAWNCSISMIMPGICTVQAIW